MRSTRNVRACHLLRVMRASAPTEWSQGLPFPSIAPAECAAPAIAEPEAVRVQPRLVAAAHDFDLPLPPFVERLAARLDRRLDGLATRLSDFVEAYGLRRRARSLRQLRRRELARVQLL